MAVQTPSGIAAAFTQRMHRRDRELAALLAREYEHVADRLRRDVARLIRSVERDLARGVPMERVTGRLQGAAALADLVDRYERAVAGWAAVADGVVSGEYTRAAAAAVADVAGVVPGVMRRRVPEDALAAIIGNVTDPLDGTLPSGTVAAIRDVLPQPGPVRDVLASFGRETAAGFARILVDGVGAGRNPRAVARELVRVGMRPLHRALTIARTEMIRAYREASRAIFGRHTDVIEGWIWHATLDPRTCASCLAQHGEFHQPTESLASHPNCRCAMVPVVPGIDRDMLAGKGDEWLRGQPERVQRAVLGREGAELYRSGDLRLADWVRRTSSPVWGAGSQQASLLVAKLNASAGGRHAG